MGGDQIEIRVPTEDDRVAIDRIHSIVFAWTQRPEELERRPAVLDLDRFRIAVDRSIGTGGDAVIGVAGSYAFDMTLPGGATVPIGGITGVGVLPTHRRRGILRRLVDAVHDDIAGRGEPIMALYASEGAIYERFGYGVAGRARKVEIDRRRAAWRPWIDEMTEADGPVVLLAGADPVPEMAPRWDAYRTTRPGELSRSEAWWRYMLAAQGEGLLRAVHAEGYAVWKVTPHWNDGHPAHGADDALVVESDGGRWEIGPAGCRRVRRRPDLVGDRSALSALLLGGVRPSELIAGGRFEARAVDVAGRADALFTATPLPHCQTGF